MYINKILAIAFILIGFYCAFKKPIWFVFLFGLTASGKDAYGVLHFLSLGIHNYAFYMNVLLIITVMIAIINNGRVLYLNRYRDKQLLILLIVMAVLFVEVILRSFNIKIFIPGVYASYVADYAPIVLLLLLLYRDTDEIVKLLYIFVGIQAVLAFCTIYLPEIGISVFEKIRSVNYMTGSEYTHLYDVSTASFNSIFATFTNKYIFNQFAIFHNSNDTGFYGAVTFFLYLYATIKNNKVIHKLFCLLMSIMGIMLWANSGMKGPVVGIIVGTILFFVIFNENAGRVQKAIGVFALIIVALIGVISSEAIFASLFGNESILTSITSRNTRRAMGIKYVMSHPIFGALGEASTLTLSGADVHELPFYLAALFGIPVSVLYCISIYYLPIKEMIKKKKPTYYQCVLFCILLFVSITNVFTDNVLFWFILASIVGTEVNEVEEKQIIAS